MFFRVFEQEAYTGSNIWTLAINELFKLIAYIIYFEFIFEIIICQISQYYEILHYREGVPLSGTIKLQ